MAEQKTMYDEVRLVRRDYDWELFQSESPDAKTYRHLGILKESELVSLYEQIGYELKKKDQG